MEDHAIPETLRTVISSNAQYGIHLLEGGDLIFFPA